LRIWNSVSGDEQNCVTTVHKIVVGVTWASSLRNLSFLTEFGETIFCAITDYCWGQGAVESTNTVQNEIQIQIVNRIKTGSLI
jgi:hypothetical protein